jgi:hypothetical protein
VRLIFVTLLLASLGGAFVVSVGYSAEVKTVPDQDDGVTGNSRLAIGDPLEIFVKEIPDENVSVSEKPQSDIVAPKSFREFFTLVKKDVKRGTEGLKVIADDMKQRKRHSFRDANFVPPPRPDWR